MATKKKVSKWKRSQTSSGYYKLYPWGYTLIKIRMDKSSITKSGVWYSVLVERRGTGGSYLLGQYEKKAEAIKAIKAYMRKN